tara:strand:+ start:148 stop:435 length:288 start_codon:yes stop_codon:yes gene_type:complete
MAVGDIVIGGSADNTVLNFQPAATVSVLITAAGLDDESAFIGVTNGVLNSRIGNPANEASNGQGNTKIFINNTIYLTIIALGAGVFSTYHGVQAE